MLTYFLFFFYLFCGTLLLHFIVRRKIFPFTIYHTAAIVFFRIFMGCLYGWVFRHYYGGDDTWNFFDESKDQTDLLLLHPVQFFHEFLPSFAYHATGNHLWQAFLFYVDNFERWFMVKGLAILNLFSGKNYYIDVLLFDMLTIPGPLLLFKMLSAKFPLRSGMYFLLVFFIPSVIFWCSGIRAEALLLLCIVLILYNGDDYALNPRRRNIPGMAGGLLRITAAPLSVFADFSAGLYRLPVEPEKKDLLSRLFLTASMQVLLFYLPSAFSFHRPTSFPDRWQKHRKNFFCSMGIPDMGWTASNPVPSVLSKSCHRLLRIVFCVPFPGKERICCNPVLRSKCC